MAKKPHCEHFVNVATYYSEALSQEDEMVLKYHVVYLLDNTDPQC